MGLAQSPWDMPLRADRATLGGGTSLSLGGIGRCLRGGGGRGGLGGVCPRDGEEGLGHGGKPSGELGPRISKLKVCAAAANDDAISVASDRTELEMPLNDKLLSHALVVVVSSLISEMARSRSRTTPGLSNNLLPSELSPPAA